MPYRDITTDATFESRLPHLRQTILSELQKRGSSIPKGYRFESVSGGDRNEDVRMVIYSRPNDPEAFMAISCQGAETTGYVVTDILTAREGGRPRRTHLNADLPQNDYSGPERRV